MSLQTTIQTDLQAAMRAKAALQLEVLRSIKTAFANEAVVLGRGPQGELSDDEALKIITRLSKQRLDSAEQFKNGDRDDLAQKEEAEYEIITQYLPAQLSDDELEKIIKTKQTELEIQDKSKMGILIGAVMKEVGSTADGNRVKDLVAKSLN